MADVTTKSGWERLSNGFDIEFRNGIPVRLSDNARKLTIPESVLIQQIARVSGLQVKLGKWQSGENPDEHEAPLIVASNQLEEILRRLALSSAAMFVERYHKPIEKDAVDWDTLEYAADFRKALIYCGLEWGDADKDNYIDDYVETMHQATRRFAKSTELPMVQAE